MLKAPPPDIPIGWDFITFVAEQLFGISGWTELVRWLVFFITIITFTITVIRRLSRGAEAVGEVVLKSSGWQLVVDILAGIASAFLILLVVAWGVATYWVAMKWGSWVERSRGPFAGDFPVNGLSVGYLLILAFVFLYMARMALFEWDPDGGLLPYALFMIPAVVIILNLVFGAIDSATHNPNDPSRASQWIGIGLYHLVGIWGAPIVLGGVRMMAQNRRLSLDVRRYQAKKESMLNDLGLVEPAQSDQMRDVHQPGGRVHVVVADGSGNWWPTTCCGIKWDRQWLFGSIGPRCDTCVRYSSWSWYNALMHLRGRRHLA